ncbi:hypothetical protein BHF69_05440 [Anaerostipes sp. 992a]|uniref:glycosyltransferase family 1 protein n=1 Tax=Anaerostipes sp. 992a TaxID=1261637 RepID=UPI0009531731|nr:glycosyltransferase family 1 protein [Anaerostipes sp. 992a]OLR62173.1 hypothetical protein BHF69_05440 [Anaerostipes sp. 992a]
MAIRVLQVVTIMDRGGEETMIMNYYRHMDRNKVQFDFLVHRQQKGIYEDEIEALGGKIYRAFPIRPWNYNKYNNWLEGFFREHREFEAVHAHILENCGFVLNAARKTGINVRIAHSHLAQIGIDIKYPFRIYGKYVIKKCGATNLLACGEEAGQYLFGKQAFKVLPNAVDLSLFSFNPEIRLKKRKELGLEGKFVLGNVARFHPVKNQIFLIDIFKEVVRQNSTAILLLVGVGEELKNVRNRVKELKLEESVRFLYVRTDVNELLQAMDVFVFPSKLEGLPLSLVEAQAAGLPCILSDKVAKETAITDLVQFVPLGVGAENWATTVLSTKNIERKNSSEQIKKAHYDIIENGNWLQNLYLRKNNE